MPSLELQNMMNLVAEKTGYGVSVISSHNMRTWADMISASRNNPRHLIRVNSKYHKYGDYLVALQCAMLIIKWAEPTRIPFFVLRHSSTKEIVERVASAREVSNLPLNIRHQFSRMIVEGLLNQLQSTPTEMMAIEMCYALCRGLRGIQEEAIKVNLREMTESLSPEIRGRTPSEIFNRNAAMNAAFCLTWAERSGDTTAVIPFETLGFVTKGQELFDAYRAIPEGSAQRYVLTVDRWAEILKMESWYEWEYRSEVN